MSLQLYSVHHYMYMYMIKMTETDSLLAFTLSQQQL